MIEIIIKCDIIDNIPKIEYDCDYSNATLDQFGMVIGALENAKLELLNKSKNMYAIKIKRDDKNGNDG